LKADIKIFKTPSELAEKLAEELVVRINDSAEKKKILTVALSGGSTPELLFSMLGDNFSKSARWKYVNFFWVDERCVPPENSESNYREANDKFFKKIDIPLCNIHRIRGERRPEKEVLSYSEEVSEFTRSSGGLPVFDIILLGVGEDGHTASIFPGNLKLFTSDKICEIAAHPVTGQKRITITGKVINNAPIIYFLVTGNKKSDIVGQILNEPQSSQDLPASHIASLSGTVNWYLDEEAGRLYRMKSVIKD
jgi:6-phosphogluconolactonase